MRLHDEETVARYRAMGAWTEETIDGLFSARVAAEPDRPAIVDPLNRAALMEGPMRTLTWAELDEAVWRTAAVLRHHGVQASSVVGVQLPNTVEIAVTFLAVVRLGAIVCPFPVQYRSHELVSLSEMAGVEVLVTAGRIGTRGAAAEAVSAAARVRSIRSVLAWGATGDDGSVDLDEAVAATEIDTVKAVVAAHRADPADCVTICWTSGTESTPKGVPRAHCDWLAMCTSTVEGPALTGDDVLLNPFPMVNMAGINGMFLPWLTVGGLLVQHHPFDLAVFLSQIEQYRVTYTVAPPALLTQLLQHDELLATTDLSSLRSLGSGSTPLAPSLLQGWHDRYDIDILNFYGSNEGIALLGLPADIPDAAERAIYFPRYGVPGRQWSFRMANWTSTRIVDVDTGEVITEPGRPGELRIKGPSVFAGYLPASGVPSPFDGDGYLRTGDLLEIAGADGEYLHYVDRIKDLVVRGGMKISAAEIEGLLAGHPDVADVALVGYPDDVLGERSCAVVVPRPGAVVELESLVSYLRNLDIATYKLPERIEVVDELPRNPVGKVLKRELRARLVEPLATA
jgi:acyl-CoA synthetase